MMRFLLFALFSATIAVAQVERDQLNTKTQVALNQGAAYFSTHAATRGGYVYYYSPDFKKRLGEGVASESQIWVQAPGTPTVGLAFLKTWQITRNPTHLQAAKDAAYALIYGQLKSGGWTNAIDFDQKGSRVSAYRNGRGKGRNYSSLDDGITQVALRFLIEIDQALESKDAKISESVQVALNSLLKAQFKNGGFPQVWDDTPSELRPAGSGTFPTYDWRSENRIKNYWDLPTLNDGVAGTVAETLLAAHKAYGSTNPRYLQALRSLGDFLISAQMPTPQPGWAQQYDAKMRPVWARAFEPPAIAGRESQDVLETLLLIAKATKDAKYLRPISPALDYLKRSRLPNGQLARYYELESNRPLFMTRQGKSYSLTYDDSKLPNHYGWKITSRLDLIEAGLAQPRKWPIPIDLKVSQIEKIIESQGPEGQWLSKGVAGQLLVGQPKFRDGETYISSAVFAENMASLCRFLTEN